MTDIDSALLIASKQLSKLSDSASLDAEIILCHVLNKTRSYLRAWPEKTLSSNEQEQFQQLLNQRLTGTPIAYITGEREFWSRSFTVTPDVLIPRPDTELLIEISLNLIANKAKARLIDLGTGSGIIAITLAAERPDIEMTATDSSQQALAIARLNATTHKTRGIQFIQSNWFDQIAPSIFDLIISNPPYIAHDDPHLFQGDLHFEPQSALIADENGLKDITTICQQAPKYLTPQGSLLIEHGFKQETEVQAIFNSFNYKNITTYNDLSGNPRVTTGQNPVFSIRY